MRVSIACSSRKASISPGRCFFVVIPSFPASFSCATYAPCPCSFGYVIRHALSDMLSESNTHRIFNPINPLNENNYRIRNRSKLSPPNPYRLRSLSTNHTGNLIADRSPVTVERWRMSRWMSRTISLSRAFSLISPCSRT